MSPLEFLNYTLTYIATSSGEHIYKVTRVLLVRTRQDRVGDEEEEEEGKEGRRVFSIPPTCDSFYSFSLSLTPSFFLFTLFFFLSFRSLRHPASLYHPTSLSPSLSSADTWKRHTHARYARGRRRRHAEFITVRWPVLF